MPALTEGRSPRARIPSQFVSPERYYKEGKRDSILNPEELEEEREMSTGAVGKFPTLSEMPTRSFISEEKPAILEQPKQVQITISSIQKPVSRTTAIPPRGPKSELTSISERAFLDGIKPSSAFYMMLNMKQQEILKRGRVGVSGESMTSKSERTAVSSTSRQRQREHAEKLTRDQELRERSRQELSILAANKEMEPCTFHPQRFGKSKEKPTKMTVKKAKQFFEKQVDFRIKKIQKIETELQKRKALSSIERSQGKPQICKNSEEILKQKQKKQKSLSSRSPLSQKMNVHERLYKNGKDVTNALSMSQVLETSVQKSEESIAVTETLASKKVNHTFILSAESSPFKPTINQRSKELHRNKDIVTILHQDAKRREQRKRVIQSARIPKADLVSKKSEALMFEKFESRLTNQFRNIDQGERGILEYQHFSTLLSNLDFLFTDQYKVAKEVPEMLYELWECVCPQPYENEQDERDGKQSGWFTFSNIRIILAGIMNFHFKWMEKPISLENEELEKIEETGATPRENGIDGKWEKELKQKVEKIYGVEFTKKGDASLSFEGQQILHNKFKGLYYIYHQNYTYQRRERAKIKFNKPSFSPSLCNRSKLLDVSGEMSGRGGEREQNKNRRHEVLIAKGQEYEKKKEKMRKMKQDLEDQSYPFKPKILGEEAAKKVLFRSNSSQDLREKNLQEFDQMLKQRAKVKLEQDIDFIDGDTGGANAQPSTSLLQRTIERKSRLEKLATPKQRLELQKQDLDFFRNHEHCSFHPKISKYEQPKRKKERVIKKITSYGNKRKEPPAPTPPSIDHLVNQKQLKGMLQELNLSAHSSAQKEIKSFEQRMKIPPSPPSQIERIIQEVTPDLIDRGQEISSPKPLNEIGDEDTDALIAEERKTSEGVVSQEEEDEEEPQLGDVILEMNVKLEDGRAKVLLIRDGETAKEAARKFAIQTGISGSLERKLEHLVQQQLNSVLSKIMEEEEMSALSKQA